MSTRTKTFGLILIVFLISLVSLYFASTHLILNQFAAIEKNNLITDDNRGVNALLNKADQLEFKAIDWANWDDTYKFVVDRNQAYATSNLQLSALQDLGINFMLFINNAGQLVKGVGLDLQTGKGLSVPASLGVDIKPGSYLLQHADTTTHIKGLLNLPEHPLTLVSLPILTSAGDGPTHGTLIFGQYLTNVEIGKLAELTQLNLNYYALDQPNLPADIAAVSPSLSTNQVVVKPVNSQTVVGYSIMPDIYGKPFLVARVQTTRDLFNQGRRSAIFDLVVIAFVTLAALLSTLYITNKLVEKNQIIQLKDEFFSMASHELRTPLTAIRENSLLALDLYGGQMDETLTTAMKNINRSSSELIKVVNNFLDAARLEQGRIVLNPSRFALNEVVSEVSGELAQLAAEKGTHINFTGLADLPLVQADRDRVREVVYNLLGNALKYTNEGGVILTAQVADSQIEVTVADNGAGMSEEQKKRVFQKFRPGDSGGAGIGLYISKLLIEKMGGRLELVSSVKGRGTIFRFGLPLAR